MATGTDDGGSACSGVPLGRGVELSSSAEPDEQLLDQEAVVADEPSVRHLLVGEVGVFDLADAGLVAVAKNAMKFLAGPRHPSGHDESRITEIDDAYLAAVADAPSMAKFRRQARLSPVGHLRSRCTGQRCSKRPTTRRVRRPK